MTQKPRTVNVAFWIGRASFIAVTAAMFLLLSGPIRAQSLVDVKLLTPREVQRLNNQVHEIYDKAVKALDHVDPAAAIQLFDQASQLALEATELHFMTARLAHMRARVTYRDEAAKYYDIAEKALDRVGNQKDLSPLTKQRYETQKKLLTEEKKKLEVRDARRKAFGEAFRKIYAQEAYTETEGTTGEGTAAKPAEGKGGESGSKTSQGALTAGGTAARRDEGSIRRSGDSSRREPRSSDRPRSSRGRGSES